MSLDGIGELATSRVSNLRDVRAVDSNWWGMLSEASSLVATPTSTASRVLSDDDGIEARETSSGEHLDQSQMNEGYFARFFEEVQLLGQSRSLVAPIYVILTNVCVIQVKEARAPSISFGMS